jgi:hypothetical protein
VKVFDKAKIRREIERDRRAAQHRHVSELRALISLAILARRERRHEIRTQCATARRKLRQQCALRQERAKLEGAARIAQRKRELRDEKHTERLLRSADRRLLKGSVRSTRAERRHESDDEVRGNIPRELVAAFDKHKKQIRGTQRRTRTEAFLQWAEENAGEVYALQNEQADRDIVTMVKQHNREARKVGRAQLAEVPF